MIERYTTGTDRDGKPLATGDRVIIIGKRSSYGWTFRAHAVNGDSEWIEVYGASGDRAPTLRAFPVERVKRDSRAKART